LTWPLAPVDYSTIIMKRENHLLTERQEAHARALAQRRPDASQPRLRLALHCWRKGELAEALEWADRALALDPQNINAYRIRAIILSGMRQTAKAVETALRARAMAPQSVPAHLLTVRMLLEDLQTGKAQEALEAALELEPDTQDLQQLKVLQQQILAASRQAEQKPLDWITRKFNRRLANVAGEDPDSA